MRKRMRNTRVRNTKDSYPPSERSKYGVIATIANQETGEVRVLNFSFGTSVQATRLVAEACDELGREWLVRTLSHPLSILGDIEGRTNHSKSRSTESVLLGRIHRTDLIEAERSSRAPRRRIAA